MKLLFSFLEDEQGGLVEYVLLIALIALAAITAVTTLGTKVSTTMSSVTTAL
jgi:pilus assembly protein Flp/PilA